MFVTANSGGKIKVDQLYCLPPKNKSICSDIDMPSCCMGKDVMLLDLVDVVLADVAVL